MLSLLIYNSAIWSSAILKNISRFNLIIVNFERNYHLISNLKQLVVEFFKLVPYFFWTTGMSGKSVTRLVYDLDI